MLDLNLFKFIFYDCIVQSPCKVILDKCIYGKKVIRCPAVFEADTEGNLPGTRGYRKQDGSFLSNLVKNPKVVNLITIPLDTNCVTCVGGLNKTDRVYLSAMIDPLLKTLAKH